MYTVYVLLATSGGSTSGGTGLFEGETFSTEAACGKSADKINAALTELKIKGRALCMDGLRGQ